MILDILKFAIILVIAFPFVYMMYEVIWDVAKRVSDFLNSRLRPVRVRNDEARR
jgi:hypothetical protein